MTESNPLSQPLRDIIAVMPLALHGMEHQLRHPEAVANRDADLLPVDVMALATSLAMGAVAARRLLQQKTAVALFSQNDLTSVLQDRAEHQRAVKELASPEARLHFNLLLSYAAELLWPNFEAMLPRGDKPHDTLRRHISRINQLMINHDVNQALNLLVEPAHQAAILRTVTSPPRLVQRARDFRKISAALVLAQHDAAVPANAGPAEVDKLVELLNSRVGADRAFVLQSTPQICHRVWGIDVAV